MSTLFARTTAVMAIVATVSLVGKEGYFYKLDASNQAVICAATTDVPRGVILAVSENGLEISGAVAGGNHGTIRMKCGTAVTDLRKLLTLKADGSVESDDATGARVVVAVPLEVGAVDELIECVLIHPVVYAS